jgi:phenylalanyl-tRNA synthetase beta chain
VPIVNIDLGWLSELLGKELPPDEMAEALDQLGCDVEEVVEVQRSRCPSCNALVDHPVGQEQVKACGFCGFQSEEAFAGAGRLPVVRLDLLAARPDLFDVGGLARALRGTLGLAQGLPKLPVSDGDLQVQVDPAVQDKESYRPFIRCAVVVIPRMDERVLMTIMKLQENLHWGVGRDRKLASIGIYDLDKVRGPITYRTLDPDNEPFEPLAMPGVQMSGRQILEEHPKGTAYAHLLADLKRYPLLVDADDQVLSMPPIINSEGTRVTLESTRLFIDVTGISKAAVVKALDTLVSSLVELGGSVETVTVTGWEGEMVTPDLNPRTAEVELDEARRWLGLPLDADQMITCLQRMRFDAEPADAERTRFQVRYPAYRTDIRHQVDVLEDLAIGYGYKNIEPLLSLTMTVGEPRPEEVLSNRARSTLVGLGFSEVMSLPLTTEQDHFERFRLPVPDVFPEVANPKLKALTVVRTHLMTGLLEALYENRRRTMPLRLFEIDNVVAVDHKAETGACEERRVVFAEIGPDAGYATVRAALDALLRELGDDGTYEAVEHPSFIEGRVAKVSNGKGFTGIIGELHPEVITGFNLDYPVALAEISLGRVV